MSDEGAFREVRVTLFPVAGGAPRELVAASWFGAPAEIGLAEAGVAGPGWALRGEAGETSVKLR
jgi:hypothetical protein